MTTITKTPLRRFRCTTDRIGRTRSNLTFWIGATDADDLAEQLHTVCRRYLFSPSFDVDVDLDAGKAWVGWGRSAVFTIEELEVSK